jgi:hypothetical protein
MAIATTVTIAAIVYDVYGITSDPVGDADDYLNAKLGATTWAAASADDRARAIVSAARWIDRVSTFSGTKTVAAQELEWPRDSATCGTTAIADGTIPDDVALAEFELAFILIGDATAQDASSQGSNVKRAKAGSAEVEFFNATTGTSSDTKLPDPAHDMLKCLLTGAGNSIAGGFSSGTDNDSDFCDTDFELNGGYY